VSRKETLKRSFYDRDPRDVAVDLLGCVLVHETTEGIASGFIVETEAYLCADDPACHAYNGPTMRNRTMFSGAGLAYVYRSYGIHTLLNVVCEEEGRGSAVLIRALGPLEGGELMADRRGRSDLCTGPGKLTQALGIEMNHDAHDLTRSPLTIRHGDPLEAEIVATTRIGISRGVDLPYRYLVLGDPNVSVRPKVISGRGLERSEYARPRA